MQRRVFLSRLLQFAGLVAVPTSVISATPSAPLLLQTSPVAGFQYHQGEARWGEIHLGDLLQLFREPDNRHDPRAIRIEWRGHKLGYIPRAENATLASLMDRGHHLAAQVVARRESHDPWQRLAVNVMLSGYGSEA